MTEQRERNGFGERTVSSFLEFHYFDRLPKAVRAALREATYPYAVVDAWNAHKKSRIKAKDLAKAIREIDAANVAKFYAERGLSEQESQP